MKCLKSYFTLFFLINTFLIYAKTDVKPSVMNLKLDKSIYKKGSWSVNIQYLTPENTTRNKVVKFDSEEVIVKDKIVIENSKFAIATIMFAANEDNNNWYKKESVFLNSGKKTNLHLAITQDRKIVIKNKKISNEVKALLNFNQDLYNYVIENSSRSRNGTTIKKDKEVFAQDINAILGNINNSYKGLDFDLMDYFKFRINHTLYNSLNIKSSSVYNHLPESIKSILDDPYAVYNSPFFQYEYSSPQVIVAILNTDLNAGYPKGTGLMEALDYKFNAIDSIFTLTNTKDKIYSYFLNSTIRGYRVIGENFSSDVEKFTALTHKVSDKKAGEKFSNNFYKLIYTKYGSEFPPVTLKDTEGKDLDIKELFDGENLVYIDVWASWCVPCVAEIPHLQKREKEFEGQKVKFVSISVDKKVEAWEKAMVKHHVHGFQFIDQEGETLKYLNIAGIPRFLIYSPDGKLIDINAPRPSNDDFSETINKLLKP